MIATLEAKGVVAIRADVTDDEKAATKQAFEFMAKIGHDSLSLPFLAIFPPGKPPILLADEVTKERFVALLNELPDPTGR